MKRAKGLIAIGDIASARLLLERAADAQEASAALLLAQTYDPAVLGAQDMRSITPDPATARDWYQKAAQLGSSDATQRLAQMQNYILTKAGDIMRRLLGMAIFAMMMACGFTARAERDRI